MVHCYLIRFARALICGYFKVVNLDFLEKVYEHTPMEFWYVYILRSTKDSKFYAGSTNDLKRRLQQHQRGQNTSTAKRLPLELIYFEGHRSKEDAVRREKYFKTMKGKVTLRQVVRTALSGNSAEVVQQSDRVQNRSA